MQSGATGTSDSQAALEADSLAKAARIPQTGDDFYQLLKNSQLLAKSILTRLNPLLPSLMKAPAHRMAKTFVDQRAMTLWQAEQFLLGRTKMYLPGYKLLQPLPKTEGSVTFVAEQLQHQRMVSITITKSTITESNSPIAFGPETQQVHGKIVRIFEQGSRGNLRWKVENFVEGHTLEELLLRPEFCRGQCFEIAQQLFKKFCNADSPAIDWANLNASHILIDRHGDLWLKPDTLLSPFGAEVFDRFIVFLDNLFAGHRETADEILLILAKTSWYNADSCTNTEIIQVLHKHARSLQDAIPRPKLAHSREYLRAFIRKSPPEGLIHSCNMQEWADLVPRAEPQEHTADTSTNKPKLAVPSLNSDGPGPKKVRTRYGLPVKLLVVMTALILNGISYLHSNQNVTSLSAGEEPETIQVTVEEKKQDTKKDKQQSSTFEDHRLP